MTPEKETAPPAVGVGGEEGDVTTTQGQETTGESISSNVGQNEAKTVVWE